MKPTRNVPPGRATRPARSVPRHVLEDQARVRQERPPGRAQPDPAAAGQTVEPISLSRSWACRDKTGWARIQRRAARP